MNDVIEHHGKPLPCPHCGQSMPRLKLIAHLANVRDDSVYCVVECGCSGRELSRSCFVARECERCHDSYNRMAVFG